MCAPGDYGAPKRKVGKEKKKERRKKRRKRKKREKLRGPRGVMAKLDVVAPIGQEVMMAPLPPWGG